VQWGPLERPSSREQGGLLGRPSAPLPAAREVKHQQEAKAREQQQHRAKAKERQQHRAKARERQQHRAKAKEQQQRAKAREATKVKEERQQRMKAKESFTQWMAVQNLTLSTHGRQTTPLPSSARQDNYRWSMISMLR